MIASNLLYRKTTSTSSPEYNLSKFIAAVFFLCLIIPISSHAGRVTVELRSGDWHQFAIPATRVLKTPRSLFQPDMGTLVYGTDWTVFSYSPEVGYVEPDLDDFLSPGTALWIIQASGNTISIDFDIDGENSHAQRPDACTLDSNCALVEFGRSETGVTWLMAGSPFSESTNVQQLRIRNSSEDGICSTGCTIGELAASDLGDTQLYTYDASTNAYAVLNESSRLEPLQGFWYGVKTPAPTDQYRLEVPWEDADTQSVQAHLDTRADSAGFGVFNVSNASQFLLTGTRTEDGLPQTLSPLLISDAELEFDQLISQRYDQQGRIVQHSDPVAGSLIFAYPSLDEISVTWELPTGERVTEIIDISTISSNSAITRNSQNDTVHLPLTRNNAVNSSSSNTITGQVAAFCPVNRGDVKDAEIIVLGKRYPQGLSSPPVAEAVHYERIGDSGVFSYAFARSTSQGELASNQDNTLNIVDSACLLNQVVATGMKKKAVDSLVQKVISLPRKPARLLGLGIVRGIDAICELSDFKERMEIATAVTTGVMEITAHAYRPQLGGAATEKWLVNPDAPDVAFKSIILKEEACPGWQIEITGISCIQGPLSEEYPNMWPSEFWTMSGIAFADDERYFDGMYIDPDANTHWYLPGDKVLSGCRSWSGVRFTSEPNNSTWRYCQRIAGDSEKTWWKSTLVIEQDKARWLSADLVIPGASVKSAEDVSTLSCPGSYICRKGKCR